MAVRLVRRDARRDAPSEAARQVIWHDLECGAYRADLALWLELAQRQRGPVLEIGAGSGRVSLHLARGGYAVTALDREPALLDALRERDDGATVRTVCVDARHFSLDGERFALCVVPMQTVQLLDGAGRRSLFSNVRAVLNADGLLACAILGRVQPFDCARGDLGPAPDTAVVDGVLYSSRATRVTLDGRRVTIERERRTRALAHRARAGAAGATEPTFERDVVSLHRVGVRELQREAAAAGLRAQKTAQLPATEDYAASQVVLLRG
ncbi:MAG TPA: class I SAM-dependent methyltransferase [Solirubrobacteraceae bacterium]|jgi:SAM-dependent methyltransferase|nr:class I SAM-dependent methyltransferase [Solirubrobacteraceae bacterium]